MAQGMIRALQEVLHTFAQSRPSAEVCEAVVKTDGFSGGHTVVLTVGDDIGLRQSLYTAAYTYARGKVTAGVPKGAR